MDVDGGKTIWQALGIAMTDWENSIGDCVMAIRAAEAMSKRFKTDIAIMPDLSVMPLFEARQPPLEIISYDEPR